MIQLSTVKVVEFRSPEIVELLATLATQHRPPKLDQETREGLRAEPFPRSLLLMHFCSAVLTYFYSVVDRRSAFIPLGQRNLPSRGNDQLRSET